MKLIRILLLLLTASGTIYSQELKMISIEVKNLIDDSGYCGNVYYTTEYGCSHCYQCMDGKVVIYYMPSKKLHDRAYISFREDKYNVSNINIECLLTCNSTIMLSKNSVRVTACESGTLEDYPGLGIIPSSCVESKQFGNQHGDYDFFPRKVFRNADDNTRFMVNWFS